MKVKIKNALLNPISMFILGLISGVVVKEIDMCLEARELVKVKLQEGCDLTPKDVANDVAARLGAEFVQAIGRKFTLYRRSKENKQIELPKP